MANQWLIGKVECEQLCNIVDPLNGNGGDGFEPDLYPDPITL